ncbi:hypothetical protein EYF80_015798 [Liparis tanakae]|uniref:Uncharacterized protein n=1 Tax=Liparis tanakae TaxID=230148 RepID=A0A4Z2I7G0_9TELE|nr:hypothetical protein EYF80_015798 [Liparis tanakae]
MKEEIQTLQKNNSEVLGGKVLGLVDLHDQLLQVKVKLQDEEETAAAVGVTAIFCVYGSLLVEFWFDSAQTRQKCAPLRTSGRKRPLSGTQHNFHETKRETLKRARPQVVTSRDNRLTDTSRDGRGGFRERASSSRHLIKFFDVRYAILQGEHSTECCSISCNSQCRKLLTLEPYMALPVVSSQLIEQLIDTRCRQRVSAAAASLVQPRHVILSVGVA